MVSTVLVHDAPLSAHNCVTTAEPSFRRSFSSKEKREYVQAVELVFANHQGMSCCQACATIGFSQIYYIRFKKAIKKVDDLEQGVALVTQKINGTARRIHPGRTSILSVVQEDLSCFVFEDRQRGIQVSTRMLRQEAYRLLPSFRDKSLEARKKAVNRFTKKMGLAHRVATHTVQRNYQETEE